MKLTSKQRNKLPKSAFALPDAEKYPVNDKAHARNAKARASQQYKKGNLTKSELNKINQKADKVIGNKKTKKDAVIEYLKTK